LHVLFDVKAGNLARDDAGNIILHDGPGQPKGHWLQVEDAAPALTDQLSAIAGPELLKSCEAETLPLSFTIILFAVSFHKVELPSLK
jgi:hypothetical protein